MRTQEDTLEQVKKDYKTYAEQFPFETESIMIQFLFHRLAMLQFVLEELIEREKDKEPSK